MKATMIAIILVAMISTSATAAEPQKQPLSPADAKYVAEYEQLSEAIDRVCAIWERDLHQPEKLPSTASLLEAVTEISNKHKNDLDLACGATHEESMRQREMDSR